MGVPILVVIECLKGLRSGMGLSVSEVVDDQRSAFPPLTGVWGSEGVSASPSA